jgi:hypothetical protein
MEDCPYQRVPFPSFLSPSELKHSRGDELQLRSICYHLDKHVKHRDKCYDAMDAIVDDIVHSHAKQLIPAKQLDNEYLSLTTHQSQLDFIQHLTQVTERLVEKATTLRKSYLNPPPIDSDVKPALVLNQTDDSSVQMSTQTPLIRSYHHGCETLCASSPPPPSPSQPRPQQAVLTLPLCASLKAPATTQQHVLRRRRHRQHVHVKSRHPLPLSQTAMKPKTKPRVLMRPLAVVSWSMLSLLSCSSSSLELSRLVTLRV